MHAGDSDKLGAVAASQYQLKANTTLKTTTDGTSLVADAAELKLRSLVGVGALTVDGASDAAIVKLSVPQVSLASETATDGVTLVGSSNAAGQPRVKCLIAGTGMELTNDGASVTVKSKVDLGARPGRGGGETSARRPGRGPVERHLPGGGRQRVGRASRQESRGGRRDFLHRGREVGDRGVVAPRVSTISNAAAAGSVTLSHAGPVGSASLVDVSMGPDLKTRGLVAGTAIEILEETATHGVKISSKVDLSGPARRRPAALRCPRRVGTPCCPPPPRPPTSVSRGSRWAVAWTWRWPALCSP